LEHIESLVSYIGAFLGNNALLDVDIVKDDRIHLLRKLVDDYGIKYVLQNEAYKYVLYAREVTKLKAMVQPRKVRRVENNNHAIIASILFGADKGSKAWYDYECSGKKGEQFFVVPGQVFPTYLHCILNDNPYVGSSAEIEDFVF
jgi:hypothetical protein